jgi:hypothetical protein
MIGRFCQPLEPLLRKQISTDYKKRKTFPKMPAVKPTREQSTISEQS